MGDETLLSDLVTFIPTTTAYHPITYVNLFTSLKAATNLLRTRYRGPKNCSNEYVKRHIYNSMLIGSFRLVRILDTCTAKIKKQC